jgi:hypothetical protein
MSPKPSVAMRGDGPLALDNSVGRERQRLAHARYQRKIAQQSQLARRHGRTLARLHLAVTPAVDFPRSLPTGWLKRSCWRDLNGCLDLFQ